MKNIKSIITKPGCEATDPKHILNMLHEYYGNVYNKNNESDHDFDDFVPVNKLSTTDNKELESDITIKECKEALDGLPANKTPGTDGLTAEFYRHFWPIIVDHLYNSIITSVELGELSVEQKRGIITLIPKAGKDLKYIKNWRPISILNVDYKIIAKILANRLKPVLPTLINNDQLAYVQDRIIGENLRIVKDIMDYTSLHNMSGILMLVDFEKAFDSLNRTFLDYTLDQYGFGSKFKGLVTLLYTNISSVVLNNGFTTNKIDLLRGIRQGCPVSAYFFILCAELLADAIRQDKAIRGLSIYQKSYKILQFADDAIIMAKDLNDVRLILKMLDKFGKCSGLKINLDKSELFKLGLDGNETGTHKGLKWCTTGFKYLGIWYLKNELDMEYKNFRHRLDNIINLF
ncbi:MAG: reverse transcriptase family protein [Clostridium sp.]